MHGPAAQNVHVNVENGLTRLGAVIEDDPEPVADAVFPGQSGADAHHLADELLIVAAQGRGAGDMLSGDDEKMFRGLGRNVPEGENVLILIDFFAGDVAADDFAEQAVRVHEGSSFLCQRDTYVISVKCTEANR